MAQLPKLLVLHVGVDTDHVHAIFSYREYNRVINAFREKEGLEPASVDPLSCPTWALTRRAGERLWPRGRAAGPGAADPSESLSSARGTVVLLVAAARLFQELLARGQREAAGPREGGAVMGDAAERATEARGDGPSGLWAPRLPPGTAAEWAQRYGQEGMQVVLGVARVRSVRRDAGRCGELFDKGTQAFEEGQFEYLVEFESVAPALVPQVQLAFDTGRLKGRLRGLPMRLRTDWLASQDGDEQLEAALKHYHQEALRLLGCAAAAAAAGTSAASAPGALPQWTPLLPPCRGGRYEAFLRDWPGGLRDWIRAHPGEALPKGLRAFGSASGSDGGAGGSRGGAARGCGAGAASGATAAGPRGQARGRRRRDTCDGSIPSGIYHFREGPRGGQFLVHESKAPEDPDVATAIQAVRAWLDGRPPEARHACEQVTDPCHPCYNNSWSRGMEQQQIKLTARNARGRPFLGIYFGQVMTGQEDVAVSAGDTSGTVGLEAAYGMHLPYAGPVDQGLTLIGDKRRSAMAGINSADWWGTCEKVKGRRNQPCTCATRAQEAPQPNIRFIHLLLKLDEPITLQAYQAPAPPAPLPGGLGASGGAGGASPAASSRSSGEDCVTAALATQGPAAGSGASAGGGELESLEGDTASDPEPCRRRGHGGGSTSAGAESESEAEVRTRYVPLIAVVATRELEDGEEWLASSGYGSPEFYNTMAYNTKQFYYIQDLEKQKRALEAELAALQAQQQRQQQQRQPDRPDEQPGQKQQQQLAQHAGAPQEGSPLDARPTAPSAEGQETGPGPYPALASAERADSAGDAPGVTEPTAVAENPVVQWLPGASPLAGSAPGEGEDPDLAPLEALRRSMQARRREAEAALQREAAARQRQPRRQRVTELSGSLRRATRDRDDAVESRRAAAEASAAEVAALQERVRNLEARERDLTVARERVKRQLREQVAGAACAAEAMRGRVRELESLLDQATRQLANTQEQAAEAANQAARAAAALSSERDRARAELREQAAAAAAAAAALQRRVDELEVNVRDLTASRDGALAAAATQAQVADRAAAAQQARIEELEGRVQQLTAARERLAAEKEQLAAAAAAREAELQRQVQALTARVGELTAEARADAARIAELEGELRGSRRREAEQGQRLSGAEARVAELQGELARAVEECAGERRRREQAEGRLRGLRAAAEAAVQALEV
ncbi:hypothetical protein GPECTOR_2g978 [Gonium pectorale]|uniref:Uncharacterized protein n=1 Tax=Gonium pectorale TaxID=33097 RepID=A0A150H1S0_GONPE|nr:hypothetical protein GPECTOR_2g978 [Gonium pectorale]|eukprot:KXZ56096.1 hypothetical protein GPECTOR_2g978 [Gonium pectorale]